MNESTILRGILDFLEMKSRLEDIYFFRAGSGAMKTIQGRHFKTGRPGCPDIVVCKDGRFIGLEVKTAKGRLTIDQKKAAVAIEKAGGKYHVARSISDVRKLFETLSDHGAQ